MEELTPQVAKDLTDKKKDHWKSLKEEFIKDVPEDFLLEIDWGYKDTKYYHPNIWVSDNIYLHYQCDLDTNHVYAEQVNFKNQSSNNCIYFDEVFTKEYLFKNIDYLEEVMESIAEKCKAIDNSIRSLEMMKDNLLQHAIPSTVNKQEKRKTVRTLEDLAEFVNSIKVI